ncbi:hypothetical protein, partial [Burkholderia multivorans]|uniref:hypothetical protein n=1 Tax=Burkholderia multivorans TaxID=87883 RepID=UPI00287031AB
MAAFIVVGAKMGIRKFYVDLPDKALIPYRSRALFEDGARRAGRRRRIGDRSGAFGRRSGRQRISGATNAKTPACWAGVLGLGSLTITYFHTGIRTIIGVE